MMLRATDDVGAGDWIASRLGPLGTVGGLLPSGFDAYCRLLFPIDGPASDPDPHTWAEVFDTSVPPGVQVHEALADLPDADPRRAWSVDASTCTAVLPALRDAIRPFSPAGAGVFVAVWEGWGDLPDRVRASSRLHIPGRAYHLFEGDLDDIATAPWNPTTGENPPGLIWPSDRSWFVAADTDLDSAYIGGSEALVAALVSAPGLEVVASAWADPA